MREHPGLRYVPSGYDLRLPRLRLFTAAIFSNTAQTEAVSRSPKPMANALE